MLYLRVLNKILYRIDLTVSEYTPVSKYARVLNMSGFIKKTLHHIDA